MTNKTQTQENWRIFKRGKTILNGMLLAVFGVLSTNAADAAPTGGEVASGKATIGKDGLNTNINQASQHVNINWDTFSSAANEAINFNQPNATATALNRVVGNVPSQLRGALNSNGRVIIQNNAGITFYESSQVNVGALMATTALNAHVRDGNIHFSEATNGQIINRGSINASEYAVLVAPSVENAGVIQATIGHIELASAPSFTLGLGDGKINYAVSEEQVTGDGVTNTGTLAANTITLTTKQAADLRSGSINMGGLVDATSFAADGQGGTVLVNAEGNLTNSATTNANGGTIYTYAGGINHLTEEGVMNAEGGFAEISGKSFKLDGNINAKGGEVIIDPEFVTIVDGSVAGVDEVAETDIEAMSQAGTDVKVRAEKKVTLADLSDNELEGGDGSITLVAADDSDVRTNGSVVFEDTNDTISTTSGDINILAGDDGINIGHLKTGAFDNDMAGKIFVEARDSGDVRMKSITVEAGGGVAEAEVYAGDDLYINGDIRVENIDGSAPQPHSEAYLKVTASDDFQINGDVDVIAVDPETTHVEATAKAELYHRFNPDNKKYSGKDDLVVNGDINVIADADKPGRNTRTAKADADLIIESDNGVTLNGDTNVFASAINAVGDAVADAYASITAFGEDKEVATKDVTVTAEAVEQDSEVLRHADASAELQIAASDGTFTKDGAYAVTAEATNNGPGEGSANADATLGITSKGDTTLEGTTEVASTATTNGDVGTSYSDNNAATDITIEGADVHMEKDTLTGTATASAPGNATATTQALLDALNGDDEGDVFLGNPTELASIATAAGEPGAAEADAQLTIIADKDITVEAPVNVMAESNANEGAIDSSATAGLDEDAGGDITHSDDVNVMATATREVETTDGTVEATAVAEFDAPNGNITVDDVASKATVDFAGESNGNEVADATVSIDATGQNVAIGDLSADAVIANDQEDSFANSLVEIYFDTLDFLGLDPRATSEQAELQQRYSGVDEQGAGTTDRAELIIAPPPPTTSTSGGNPPSTSTSGGNPPSTSTSGGTPPPPPPPATTSTSGGTPPPEPTAPEPQQPDVTGDPNVDFDPYLKETRNEAQDLGAGGLEDISPAAGEDLEGKFCRDVNTGAITKEICSDNKALSAL